MTNRRSELYELSERAVAIVGDGLKHACDNVDYSQLPSLDFADVLQGLLARVYQLWTVGVLSPSSATTPVYPLIARALVDSVITVAWIVENPDSAPQYKIYSAGRLKLLAEHWRTRDFGEQTQTMKDYADQLTDVASTERWHAVLPVDVGDWNGRGVRTMAIEVGLKDLYDLWYSSLSADAHAEWMSIRGKYTRLCGEELHPQHWIPLFEQPGLTPSVTVLFTEFLLQAVQHAEVGLKIQVGGLDGAVQMVREAAELVVNEFDDEAEDNRA